MDKDNRVDRVVIADKNTIKKPIIFVFLIVCIFFLGILLSELRDLKIKNSNLLKELSTQKSNTEKPVEDKITVVSADFRMYPSPNGRFILVLKATPEKGEETCDIEIYDDLGDPTGYINLNESLGLNQFLCGSGMYGLFSREFLGWHDDITLSFLTEEGIQNVTLDNRVDTPNGGNVIIYPNSHKNLQPLDVNSRKELFLFGDFSQDRTQDRMILVDLKSSRILKELTFEKESLTSPVYDYINDGYIYTQRFYTENTVETKVYFLKMSNLSVQSLLEDKQNYWGGRGCGPHRVRSINEGEVVFDPGGCLIIDKKYFSSDGNLHFSI